MHISGNNFLNGKKVKGDYYFSKYSHSWGWATWKRSWFKYSFCISDPTEYWENIKSYYRLGHEEADFWFNRFMEHDTEDNHIWDEQWQYSIWKNYGKAILPSRNLVTNIGFGSNATHTFQKDSYLSNIKAHYLTIKDHSRSEDINIAADECAFTIVYLLQRPDSTPQKIISSLKFLRNYFARYVPGFLKVVLSRQFRKRKITTNKLKRLKTMPRHVHGLVNINDKDYEFIDGASFAFMYTEIFDKEIYKFKCSSPCPIIIDAGANIGLSTIYFKEKYPGAIITSIEPDAEVYRCLQQNIVRHNLEGINLINKALWNQKTKLVFRPDGADGGKLDHERIGDSSDSYIVDTILLSEIIGERKIDMLKIDIEGAESNVIIESESFLTNVKNIFIEYHSFEGEDQHLNDILTVLKRLKFRYFLSTSAHFVTSPFMGFPVYQGIDNMINIFAVREAN
jgi:FkbM family methyltransferase